MSIYKFTNSSFVLYQILPDYKKIDFLNRSFDNNVTKLTQEIYQKHFKEVLSPVGNTEIGIVSYLFQDTDKINIFFHNDMIHVNCNKLIPIRNLIKIAFMEGNILLLDKSLKKNSNNRDRYHMRYYRAYRRINNGLYPISES